MIILSEIVTFSNALSPIDMTEFDTPPTFGGGLNQSNGLHILVKKGTLDLWLSATNWSAYSNFLYEEVE